jgi:hypothetical protein
MIYVFIYELNGFTVSIKFNNKLVKILIVQLIIWEPYSRSVPFRLQTEFTVNDVKGTVSRGFRQLFFPIKQLLLGDWSKV